MDTTQEERYTRQDIAVMLRGFIDGLCAIPDGVHRDIVEYECTTYFHRAIMDEVDKLRGQADHDADPVGDDAAASAGTSVRVR